ncbi:coiled-coil domain-containing protein 84-like [Argonauta hians]
MSLKNQFQYCSLCRLSHTGGKRHVYSKKHKQLLDKALKRFDEKISLCKKAVEEPCVINLRDEKREGQKVWCYFCSVEIDRHSINGHYLIMEHKLLAHLTTEIHKTNTKSFAKKNLLKHFEKYIFSEAEFERHNVVVIKTTEELEKQFKAKVCKKMKEIHQSESQKYSVPSNYSQVIPTGSNSLETKSVAMAETMCPPTSSISLETKSVAMVETLCPPTGSNSLETKSVAMAETLCPPLKKTLSAFGEGLTCIKMKSDNGNLPNVHSGGTPPWMQPCNKSTQREVIGPTIVDYQKHLTNVKVSKLPKDRVGANTNKEMSANAQWLPSFGCVWNNQRRLDTKLKFMKNNSTIFGKNLTQTERPSVAAAAAAATVQECRPSNQNGANCLTVPLRPYKRKRNAT